MILRARIVVPMAGPPVSDGAVRIETGRIREVGRWGEVGRQVGERVWDLGEVALLPGMVNAHCHLDYTAMAGQLVPPRSFTDWIRSITELKEGWDHTDYAESWVAGARMLVAGGTTTVADMEAVPELLPGVWERTPLRVISFLEMTGVRSRREPRVILDEMLARVPALQHGRCRLGLSPHAPYSTTPELQRLSRDAAVARGWRVSVHVAESAEESEMYVNRQGPMFAWLERNERDMGDCGGVTPVGAMAREGVLGPHLLVVHANYLGAGDDRVLGSAEVEVVHCPRSHAYFGHDRFPAEALARAGVGLSLGTDSLATVVKRRREEVRLDMLAEMRLFAEVHPGFSPEAVVRMGTVAAARAVGGAGQVGELVEGAHGDAMVVPYAGGEAGVYEGVLGHQGAVQGVMIGGRWVHGGWTDEGDGAGTG